MKVLAFIWVFLSGPVWALPPKEAAKAIPCAPFFASIPSPTAWIQDASLISSRLEENQFSLGTDLAGLPMVEREFAESRRQLELALEKLQKAGDKSAGAVGKLLAKADKLPKTYGNWLNLAIGESLAASLAEHAGVKNPPFAGAAPDMMRKHLAELAVALGREPPAVNLNGGAPGLSSGKALLPTHRELSVEAMNGLAHLKLDVLGLNQVTLAADGSVMNPYTFLLHDLAHADRKFHPQLPELAPRVLAAIDQEPNPLRKKLQHIFWFDLWHERRIDPREMPDLGGELKGSLAVWKDHPHTFDHLWKRLKDAHDYGGDPELAAVGRDEVIAAAAALLKRL